MHEPTRTCNWCEETMPLQAHWNRRFCSDQCLNSHKNRARRKQRPSRSCKHCGAVFSDERNAKAVYCTDRCTDAAGSKKQAAKKRAARAAEVGDLRCETCDAALAPEHGPGRRRRFCSSRCQFMSRRVALPPRECAQCGTAIKQPCSRLQRYCSRRCFNRAYGRLRNEMYAKEKAYRSELRACARGTCGRQFKTSRPDHIYCQRSCKSLDVGGRHTARKRARRLGDADRYTSRAVFERDQWICALCGAWVNAELKCPDPWSPSIDHRIPLAAGGWDIWANVQLAHLVCNQRKNRKRAETIKWQTLQLFPM